MSEHFPEPKSFGIKVKVVLDLSKYATSKFAKKVDLARLKFNIDELDIDKLKNVPTNLTNLKVN